MVKFRRSALKKLKRNIKFVDSTLKLQDENVEMLFSPLYELDIDNLSLSTVEPSFFDHESYELTISRNMFNLESFQLSNEIHDFFETKDL